MFRENFAKFAAVVTRPRRGGAAGLTQSRGDLR